MIYDVKGNAVPMESTVYDLEGNTIPAGDYESYNTNKDLYFFRGKPTKQGKYLVGDDGKRLEIRGVGTHGLLQYANLHSLEAIRSLRSFGVNCVRCSVYLEDYTFLNSDGIKAFGYISKPTETKAEIERIVDYCEQLGMYVILDWHIYSWGAGSGTGIFHQTEATEFFTYFCNLYKDKPFVMYEIANEPNHTTTAETLDYITAMHTLIHSVVDDPIIIMGKCSDSMETLHDTLAENGMDDIFLSCHAYGTSVDVDRYKEWWDKDYPLFNTEWGNSQASGDGDRVDDRATALLKYYHQEKIPNCIWKYTDQVMTTALLNNRGSINDSYYSGGFAEEDLSPNGTLYFTWWKYFATIGHNR